MKENTKLAFKKIEKVMRELGDPWDWFFGIALISLVTYVVSTKSNQYKNQDIYNQKHDQFMREHAVLTGISTDKAVDDVIEEQVGLKSIEDRCNRLQEFSDFCDEHNIVLNPYVKNDSVIVSYYGVVGGDSLFSQASGDILSGNLLNINAGYNDQDEYGTATKEMLQAIKANPDTTLVLGF